MIMVYDHYNIKNCWINLYKPSGITSSSCVFKIRNLLTEVYKFIGIFDDKEKIKCGHMGTLDPMAEGILPVAFGDATKTIVLRENSTKTYIFTIIWGIRTDTDDAFGNVIDKCNKIPKNTEIQQVIKQFIGKIEQIPSRFSAIHINGKRAYDLARQGKEFEIPIRTIFINELILNKSWNVASELENTYYSEFKVICSSGTYVRTLAFDIAKKLGTFGHLVKLIRVNNGVFDILDSIHYEKILDFFNAFLHTEKNKELDSFVFKDVRVLDFLKPIDYKLDEIPVLFFKEVKVFCTFISVIFFLFVFSDGVYRVYVSGLSVDRQYLVGLAEVKNKIMNPKKVFKIIKG